MPGKRFIRYTAIATLLTPLWIMSCTKDKKDTKPLPPEEPALNLNERAPELSVLLNQHAYHPDEVKRIVVMRKSAVSCSVYNSEGSLLLTLPLEDLPSHPDYDVTLSACDVSALREEGTYTIRVGEYQQEIPLRIQREALKPLLQASQRSYYYQRASMALEPQYAGDWARPAGHPDLGLTVRKVGDASEGTVRDVPGGWYDAGDYGKYMVNGGITVGTLLFTVEDFPELLDDKLGIPESGNSVIDLLDEVRYELDWFLTMQDADGGVFFKVGPLEWPGFILPHEDLGRRYITGKSTASTLNFAAACAQASRHFAAIDPAYASRLLSAAERAWLWALANPAILAPATDPTGGTGGYGDDSMDDEFLWAAVELARVDTRYQLDAQKRLLAMSARPRLGEALWWSNLHGLAFLSAARDSKWEPKVKEHITKELLQYAEQIRLKAASNPFGISYEDKEFIWGSNGGLSNQGMILLNAYRITGDERYRQGAREILHYLLGRNIHGLSFVTGFGPKAASDPHHRPSGGDGIQAPVPGFLVGGPNAALNDKGAVVYPINRRGPYCYVDKLPSFASNEVAINWNAPFTYLLAGLMSQQNFASAKETGK